MVFDKTEKKVYFETDNIFSKISEILEKNGIDISLEEALFNDEKSFEKSFIEIVFKLTISLAEGKISEENFITSIQKELGASDAIAQNINKEIKEKLLRYARYENIGENIKGKENIEIPVTPSKPVANKQNKEQIQTEPIIKEKIEPIKNNNPPRPAGPDKYRESI